MSDAMLGFVAVAVLAVIAVVMASTWVRTVRVNDWERIAVYRDGLFDRVLGPGRHRLFGSRRDLHFSTISLARQLVPVGPVDVVTKDRLPLRLSGTVGYRIEDAELFLREPAGPEVQIIVARALTRLAAEQTLEELLRREPELDLALTEYAGTRAGASSRIEEVRLTDLTLPPELRRLLTEIERARMEGLAALERARGEQAALRSLANAARLLKDNPELAQLRLLQTVAAARGATVVLGDPGVAGAKRK